MGATRIAGTGRYLPARILTNDELAQRVATSDEWIRTRTGIRQRHIAAPEETTSDLALRAARAALAAARMSPADVDLIIVATATPDMIFPSTACILQDKLGVTGGAALDVGAVCSGFGYALALADKLGGTGAARNALVVGAEIVTTRACADEMAHETPAVLAGFLAQAPNLGPLGDYVRHCFGARWRPWNTRRPRWRPSSRRQGRRRWSGSRKASNLRAAGEARRRPEEPIPNP